jgi:hypothetical protein
MRSVLLWVVLFCGVPVGVATGAECKTVKDCERLGPLCCTGECVAVTKKQAKGERKAAEQRCAAKACGAPPKTVSCEAPLVCMGGKCRLGAVRDWDAEQKKDNAKKDDAKSDEKAPNAE